jgi:hypothetical protein
VRRFLGATVCLRRLLSPHRLAPNRLHRCQHSIRSVMRASASHSRRLVQINAVTAIVCYCDKTCPLALALNFNLVHTFYKLLLYLLGQRFLGSNHITQLRRAYKTKCG